ncbi:hypothetical protein BDB01DRAFT_710582, partial [Pilobolus umbonatus]
HNHNSNNKNSKRLPLRKRISPVLKWQPVETPEEHHKQKIPYPMDHQYPIKPLFVSEEPIKKLTYLQPLKKVKRGRPPLKQGIKTMDTVLQEVDINNAMNGRPPTDNSTLYCICKRPYDVPRFMIACDRCDQWFHGECIQISEKQGEFIDLYFCESCSAKQHNPLSRGRLSSFADMDDRSRLGRVKDEKIHARSIIQTGQFKSDLLKRVIQNAVDDICGFDSRLSWSDALWEKVEGVDEERLIMAEPKPYTVCQAHKCNKHIHWQKLKLAEIEQERAEQFVILSILERERQQIKARMKKRREEVDLAAFLENGTICH